MPIFRDSLSTNNQAFTRTTLAVCMSGVDVQILFFIVLV